MTRARDLSRFTNPSALSVDSGTYNVGIGSTSPDVKLDVIGSIEASGISTFQNNLFVGAGITMLASSGIVSAIAFYGDGSNLDNTGSTLSAASGSQRIVVTSLTSGTMTSNATDADLTFDAGTNTLNVGGGANISGVSTLGNTIVGGATTELVVDGDVFVTGVGTAVQWDATSDITLKENIEIIDDPIVKLSELKGVTFDWKFGGHSVGVIAQDVEKVLPTAVGGSADRKTVNYNAIIGLLVESVKDQQKQIEKLKSLLDK